MTSTDTDEGKPVRRGLPRVAGGETPAATTAAASTLPASSTAPARPRTTASVAPSAPPRLPEYEPARIGPFTRTEWAASLVLGGMFLLLMAGAVVIGVRLLLTLEVAQQFLEAYPGEYPLPASAPV